MANVRAFRAGNWSDTNTTTSPWATGGVLYAPNSSDDVFTNGFTVTVDNSPTVVSVTNASATSRAWKDGATTTAASGGGLILSNGQTLTATTGALTTVGANFITLSGTNSAAFVGNVTANPSFGYSIVNTGSGTLTFTGYTEAAGSGGGTFRNQVAGNLVINGGVTSSANSVGVYQDAGGNLIINGYASSNGLMCINNNGVGTVTVVGPMTASNGGGNAIRSTNTASLVKASGSFICAADGTMAVAAIKMILNTTPIAAKTRYALNGTSTFVDMFTADNTGLAPAVGDVRAGVVYGSATGVLAVPAANSVAFGVPVDNTIGTAILTQANVQSALTAQGLTSARAGNLDNLDATVSSRLAPSGTLATVTNLTNAPASVTPADIWDYNSRTLTSAAPPSAVAIRQELDANSTKLSNLDASVSSRLAGSSYTAPATPPTAATIAAAVWAAADKTGYSLTNAERTAIAAAVEGSLLNEADGQAVLNAIVGAIGNQNLSEVSLVAAVRADLERAGGKLDNIPTTAAPSASAVASATRTELSTELLRIDQSISSRLAASSYTAPANSDIAAIKAKTDNLPASPAATGDIPSANITAIKAKTDQLNTDRLANVATTNIVGTLLAQANS